MKPHDLKSFLQKEKKSLQIKKKTTNFSYSDQLVSLERFICEITLFWKENIHLLNQIVKVKNCKSSNYIIILYCVGNS